MNGISPTPQPPKQQASIFLISVFIGIMFILLLLVLNYFNIPSLSQLFPSQLGWLPHEGRSIPSPEPTSVQNQNYTPTAFQYDTGKAKKIVTQYIKDNIKQEFLPETIEIKQGLSIDNRIEEANKKQFGSYFTANQSTISVNFHFKENTNLPNDFSIFIQPTNVEQTTVAPDLANSLTESYFNNPYSPITNCDKKGTTPYCEEFRTATVGKRGYGVVFVDDTSVSPPKFTPIIFTCLVPKDNKDYATQKSCISL